MQTVQSLQGAGHAGGTAGAKFTGLRGLGGPPVFDGNDEKCNEWTSKLNSYVASRWARGVAWMAWASCRTEAIEASDVELQYGEEAGEVKEFSAQLQQLLYDRTQGEAWERASEAEVGNGVESFRRIKRRFEPGTAGSKTTFPSKLLVVAWLVEHPAELLSIPQEGTDGKTAHERMKGQPLRPSFVEFGELVHCRLGKLDKMRSSSRSGARASCLGCTAGAEQRVSGQAHGWPRAAPSGE